MYDAIIFDIDGTLWNACEASAQGWNEGLARLRIDARVTASQIQGVAGRPYEECVRLLLPEQLHHPELLATLNESEREIVGKEGGQFYEGVQEGIRTLAQYSPIFLVSNCQEWYLTLFLQYSGFQPVVKYADCHGKSGLSKHHMLLNLKRKFLFTSPVYVGDTQGDAHAAEQASMDFLHAGYGFGSFSKGLSFPSFTALQLYLSRQFVR